MLGIGYVSVRCITCSCSAYLRKLSYPWNRRQYRYNKFRYKGENKQFVYWTIL